MVADGNCRRFFNKLCDAEHHMEGSMEKPEKREITAYALFQAMADEKGVYLSAIGTRNRFKVLGSSLPISVKLGENVRECSIYTTEDTLDTHNSDEDMIIVSWVSEDNNGKWQSVRYQPYRLSIEPTRNDKTIRHINLKSVGVPPYGLQVYDEHLTLTVNGECFSTGKPEPGTRAVDGNIMCQHVAGRKTIDELRAAATEVEEEKSLKERYETLLTDHGHLEAREIQLEENLNKYASLVEEYQGLVTAMKEKYTAAKELMLILAKGAAGRWFKEPELKMALEKFKLILRRENPRNATPQ